MFARGNGKSSLKAEYLLKAVIAMDSIAWSMEHNSYIRCVAFVNEDLWYFCCCTVEGEPLTKAACATKSFWAYDWKSI